MKRMVVKVRAGIEMEDANTKERRMELKRE